MDVVVLKWRSIENLLCTERYARCLGIYKEAFLAQPPDIYSLKEGVRLHR